ncbi:CidA/LrgA family protein [Rhizobium sp. R693]|uniref:CidA/LrgA family protein n=1 Tax=Rhizobium sp. R693 TaxID=1764276 RepID=UPI000B5321EB|nr:CidA/LrgA family protein [Rhizobium sp. R693]OWV86865.1 hypothetical protein ATY79_08625 [Rhizobium sp. R693]
MVVGITLLLLFQLAGEILSYSLGRVIPGPVIGMVMIAVALVIARRSPRLEQFGKSAVATSTALLANMGVLFVPAGVGIVQHLDLIRDRGIALSMTIVVSTVVTLVATVWTFLVTKRMLGSGHDE